MIHFFSVKLVNLSVIFVPVPLCKQMRTWGSFLSILLYLKYLQSNFEVPGPLRSLSWGLSFTVLTYLFDAEINCLRKLLSFCYILYYTPRLHENGLFQILKREKALDRKQGIDCDKSDCPPLKRRFVSALKIKYRIELQAQRLRGESPKVSKVFILNFSGSEERKSAGQKTGN